MQTSLIALLIFCILLSVQGYYLGWVRPPAALAWLSQSAFVTSTFLLIPSLVYVLFTQAGALGRLQDTGIIPFMGIEESVGISNGAGDEPTWIFEHGAGCNEVMDFYNKPENTGGWERQGYDGLALVLRKERQLMEIYCRKGWTSNTLIYMLKSE